MRARTALAAMAVGLLGSLEAAAQEVASVDMISVDVQGLRSGHGRAICFLYASAAGFPQDAAAALRKVTAPISANEATCRFSGVQPGAYAVAVVHDENNNGRLDRNFMGIPTEGVGASNDPHSHFGPPKYQDARFRFDGRPSTLVVHVHYLF